MAGTSDRRCVISRRSLVAGLKPQTVPGGAELRQVAGAPHVLPRTDAVGLLFAFCLLSLSSKRRISSIEWCWPSSQRATRSEVRRREERSRRRFANVQHGSYDGVEQPQQQVSQRQSAIAVVKTSSPIPTTAILHPPLCSSRATSMAEQSATLVRTLSISVSLLSPSE